MAAQTPNWETIGHRIFGWRFDQDLSLSAMIVLGFSFMQIDPGSNLNQGDVLET
jgi:hypothetical protein